MGALNRALVALAAAPLAAYGLERLAALVESRRGALPGDELLPRPLLQTTTTIEIDAVPGRVWPWVVQLVVDPEAEPALPPDGAVHVGDWLGGGTAGSPAFEAHLVEPERLLGLLAEGHLASLLPPTAHIHADIGARLAWVFLLEPLDGGRTRLTVRSRAVFHPPALALALPAIRALDWAGTLLLLEAVKRRAEPTAAGGSRRAPSEQPFDAKSFSARYTGR